MLDHFLHSTPHKRTSIKRWARDLPASGRRLAGCDRLVGLRAAPGTKPCLWGICNGTIFCCSMAGFAASWIVVSGPFRPFQVSFDRGPLSCIGPIRIKPQGRSQGETTKLHQDAAGATARGQLALPDWLLRPCCSVLAAGGADLFMRCLRRLLRLPGRGRCTCRMS